MGRTRLPFRREVIVMEIGPEAPFIFEPIEEPTESPTVEPAKEPVPA